MYSVLRFLMRLKYTLKTVFFIVNAVPIFVPERKSTALFLEKN